MPFLRSTLIASLGLMACASPALKDRVAVLESQVAELQAAEAEPSPAETPAEREEQATLLLLQAQEAVQEQRFDDARATVARLLEDYGDTRAGVAARRAAGPLEILGREAGELEVDFWFQGEATMDDGDLTLLVFWEWWCPHCKRSMPELQQTWETWGPQGLNLVALTKVTRSATDDLVHAYLEEEGLTYPVAKEIDQSMTHRFQVTGVPAAAIVQDGTILWRGHPSELDDRMFAAWLTE